MLKCAKIFNIKEINDHLCQQMYCYYSNFDDKADCVHRFETLKSRKRVQKKFPENNSFKNLAEYRLFKFLK